MCVSCSVIVWFSDRSPDNTGPCHLMPHGLGVFSASGIFSGLCRGLRYANMLMSWVLLFLVSVQGSLVYRSTEISAVSWVRFVIRAPGGGRAPAKTFGRFCTNGYRAEWW